MLQSWTVLFVSLFYVALLFAVATVSDRLARQRPQNAPRPLIYALSLGVYCTSWTYFGSVGLASRSGLDFLPIYLGPILVFTLGSRLIQAIAETAKRHNITSIADFLAARYGKSEGLGALVALIAVIGVIPYISIQLKAVTFGLETMIATQGWPRHDALAIGSVDDPALMVTVTMVIFAILFGTRHIDTTEHQHGMIAAIAVESVVKLLAFLCVGAFITWGMMGGLSELAERAAALPRIAMLFTHGIDAGRWIAMTVLSMGAILLLPRQFHVGVVENADRREIRRAAWLFPAYLVAINLFVVPIAVSGLLTFAPGAIDADTFVLALPVAGGFRLMALVAFLGGLSASTAMVIVEAVALSIMACNNLVVPIILRRHGEAPRMRRDMGERLIAIRRWAILIILGLAYFYYRMIGSSAALAQTGLISFAAIAQFAPAFLGGLIWRRGTAAGAKAGIAAGFAAWAYTLLLPSFMDAGWIGRLMLDQGPFGLTSLRPRALFGLQLDALTHGVLWSLSVNAAAYAAVSLLRQPTPAERLQADAFMAHDGAGPGAGPLRLWRTSVSRGQIEATVARYLGEERTRRAFAEFAAEHGLPPDPDLEADIPTLRFAEHLLASAIGAASSRLVMALLLERQAKTRRGAIKLLDDASAAIQYNRDLLQSAIDNVRQGIAVFDRDLALICWNRQFRPLVRLPIQLCRIGAPLKDIVAAMLGNAGIEDDALIARRGADIAAGRGPFQVRLFPDGTAIEVGSNPIPDGGFVVTFSDMTQSVEAAQALKRANEMLEQRVAERTRELTELNSALARAKAEAETANLSKTRFIAAASHDILQPLNAARLFATSLVERQGRSRDAHLVKSVDASLEAVEEILNALLDISRLDAGALKADPAAFLIGDLIAALTREFEPIARARGLRLIMVPCRLTVNSDRKMLRRVLQNFLSNAVKYTGRGRILIGCRRAGACVRIEVHDTGPGIPAAKQKLVFQEFTRLRRDDDTEPGLGLGLSIVERMAKVLKCPVKLRSRQGAGSTFSITVPLADAPAAAPREEAKVRRLPGRMHGLRLLVIDNERAILGGMTALLTGWGAQVIAARSVAEGLSAAEGDDFSFDAILADYHLHRADGLAVIAAIRARARRPIPAILITADRSRQVQERAEAQDVRYLGKPLKPASLRALLSHLVERAAPAAE